MRILSSEIKRKIRLNEINDIIFFNKVKNKERKCSKKVNERLMIE